MSRGSKTRRRSKTPSETHALRPGPNWPLLAVSSLGIALTGYLSWTAFSGGAVQGCSAGGGCDIVLTSRWATLLGLPTALWGLLAYTGLAAIAFVRRADRHWSYAWTAAFFGVCYSVYLTVVSADDSRVRVSVLPDVARTHDRHARARGVATSSRDGAPLLGGSSRRSGRARGLVILLLHANYVAPQAEPAGPEDPMTRALAEHLTEEGVLFYGASWCPHCQEQKRLFGASASRLPYIECSPAGRNAPQSPSCSRAGVRSYPTWIINGRAIVGEVLSLAQLADATEFPGAANFK